MAPVAHGARRGGDAVARRHRHGIVGHDVAEKLSHHRLPRRKDGSLVPHSCADLVDTTRSAWAPSAQFCASGPPVLASPRGAGRIAALDVRTRLYRMRRASPGGSARRAAPHGTGGRRPLTTWVTISDHADEEEEDLGNLSGHGRDPEQDGLSSIAAFVLPWLLASCDPRVDIIARPNST
jgi:hypothetical protein